MRCKYGAQSPNGALLLTTASRMAALLAALAGGILLKAVATEREC